VIGAGTAAYAAYRAIRAGDATAKVCMRTVVRRNLLLELHNHGFKPWRGLSTFE